MNIERLRKTFESARDEAIAKRLDGHSVQTEVERLLDGWVKRLVLDSLGLRDDWGRIEVRHDSPLNSAVQAAAKAEAERFVRERVQTAFASYKPSAADAKAIDTAFKRAFRDAAEDVAKAEGEQAGEAFASTAVFGDEAQPKPKGGDR